jgi:hypothetical protein
MNTDPVEIALREITDTRRLLEVLITSSESFDYARAKATLAELKGKVRVLARLEAELANQRAPSLCGRIIPFPFASPRP